MSFLRSILFLWNNRMNRTHDISSPMTNTKYTITGDLMENDAMIPDAVTPIISAAISCPAIFLLFSRAMNITVLTRNKIVMSLNTYMSRGLCGMVTRKFQKKTGPVPFISISVRNKKNAVPESSR